MISTPTSIQQVDVWRAVKSENQNLEFKEAKTHFDFQKLLEYCVAIANERGGLLLLGIANKPPRPVVGTRAYLNILKPTEDLFNKLRFRVDIEEVDHPDGRVLVFHIPSRPIGRPCELDGVYLMRSGESTVPMTPDQLKQILAEDKSDRREGADHLAAAILIVVLLILGSISFFLAKYYKPSSQNRPVGHTDETGHKDNTTVPVFSPKASPLGAKDIEIHTCPTDGILGQDLKVKGFSGGDCLIRLASKRQVNLTRAHIDLRAERLMSIITTSPQSQVVIDPLRPSTNMLEIPINRKTLGKREDNTFWFRVQNIPRSSEGIGLDFRIINDDQIVGGWTMSIYSVSF